MPVEEPVALLVALLLPSVELLEALLPFVELLAALLLPIRQHLPSWEEAKGWRE